MLNRSMVTDAERLVAAIQDLSHLSDLPGVMDVVRRTAREITGADGVTFILREGDRVYYAEENAIAPLWKGRRFPMNECVSGWVIQHREPVVIDDIYADSRVPVDAYRSTFVKSLAVVPIRAADPIGAIGAYWAAHHRATEQEIRLLTALAGSTAIAIANAELYQEAHEARAAAEAASRAKDDFLAVLSHELRTPLTSILGCAHVLKTGRRDDDQLARVAEIIERNAKAQTRLVETLLDASLVIAGRFDLAREQVDIAAIAQEACDLAAPTARAKEIQLVVTHVAEPLSVAGDAARLRQVLDAMLSNAVKFSARGGRVDVGCHRSEASAEVSVRDNGEGIDPAFLPHIFRRFRQQDGTKLRRHGGLGLSLSLAHHIVERHGGTLRAESAGRGQGALFHVTLPLALRS